MSNPMDEVRAMIQRLADASADHGLYLEQSAILTPPDGVGPDYIQVIFQVSAEAMSPTDEEQKGFDDAFAEIAGGLLEETKEEKQADRLKEAQKDVESWMKEWE